jgi:chlorite dismutase
MAIFMYVTTYKLSPTWWRIGSEDRRRILSRLSDLEKDLGGSLLLLRRYASLRWDSDIIYWLVSEDTGGLLRFRSRVSSVLGELGHETLGLLSIYEKSPYTKGDHDLRSYLGGEPLRYFIAYPMKKSPDWYLLPMEERMGIMREHIEMARNHPENRGIRSYTTYSFGIGDYEFVVIYEASSLVEWMHVTQSLREAKARKWVTKEEPIIVGELSDMDHLVVH